MAKAMLCRARRGLGGNAETFRRKGIEKEQNRSVRTILLLRICGEDGLFFFGLRLGASKA